MDMQNVSNLQIPEGGVKTIHDRNGHLLWGRVAYNTKYAGDTFQQTYSGKNKVDAANPTDANYATASLSNNVITVSSTATNTIPYVGWVIDNLSANDVVRYSSVIMDSTGQIILQFDDNGRWTTINSSVRQYSDGTTAATYSWTNTVNTTKVRLLLYANKSKPTSSSSSRYKNVILTVNNSDLSFEPYVGGTASPNPDYPQDVNVVTGEQTITISDGIDSEAFPISLGSLELCKIGTYQDYIYKSGDDWYVYKAINRVILNGSEAWSMYSGRDGTFYITENDIMLAPSTSATPDVISDYYEPKPFVSLYNMIVDYGVANHNAQRWIAIRNKDYSDVSSFKTWLASNNTIVYYVLATPANTKITDNALIGQLNAVHQWATRYGYNTTVSGDLPIVLQKDSLQ